MYPENIWTCWDSSQLLVKPIQTGEDFSAKIKSVFVPASLAGLLAFFEIWQEREIFPEPIYSIGHLQSLLYCANNKLLLWINLKVYGWRDLG